MRTTRRETPAPPPGQLVTGHFRVGAGYSTYRERGTRDWLLVCTISGSGLYRQGLVELHTRPGDFTLLRPGTPHDYGTSPTRGHWEPLWAHFVPRPDWLPLLDWPAAAPGLLHLPLGDLAAGRRARRRFFDAVRLNAGPGGQHEALALNALEEVLLWCDSANPGKAQARLDPRIRRALERIHSAFAEPLTVQSLAAHAGLSASRFAHLFRAQVGGTPQRYLEHHRLARARELLRFTQEPVRDIARQVGFPNPFYFTLRFRRHTGASPRDWRRSQG
jgi:AraC family transcriptional regulator, arabinose operon regulatory protein